MKRASLQVLETSALCVPIVKLSYVLLSSLMVHLVLVLHYIYYIVVQGPTLCLKEGGTARLLELYPDPPAEFRNLDQHQACSIQTFYDLGVRPIDPVACSPYSACTAAAEYQ